MIVEILKSHTGVPKVGDFYKAKQYRWDSDKVTLLARVDPKTHELLEPESELMNEYKCNIFIIPWRNPALHCKLSNYQYKVLRNCFDGKTIFQIIGEGEQLEEEYYFYPVYGETHSLSRTRHGHHTINKHAFKKLLSKGLIELSGFRDFIITRKGQEQILGHTQFTVEKL